MTPRAFPLSALALALTALAACGGGGAGTRIGTSTGAGASVTPLEPRSFTTVRQGDQSMVTQQRDVLVQDQASWDLLWPQHSLLKILITFPFPDVVVLATFEGEKPSGGFASEVIRTGVDPRSGDLHALVRTRAPGSFRSVPTVLTAPYHFVSVERPTPVSGGLVVERQRDLDFEVLLEGEASPLGIGDPGYVGEVVTIRDDAALDTAWVTHVGRPPAPAVDFTNEMVLLVTGAFQPTGGTRLEVLQVVEDDDATRVDAIVHPHRASTAAPVGPEVPFQLLRVARSDRPARAEARQRLPVVELASGAAAAYDGAGETMVARDQASFDDFAQRFVGAGAGAGTMVAPDFATEQALFVFLGERQITGQAISVARAAQLEDGELDVEILKVDPIRRPIAQRTSHFQVVRLPKTFGPVRARVIDITP